MTNKENKEKEYIDKDIYEFDIDPKYRKLQIFSLIITLSIVVFITYYLYLYFTSYKTPLLTKLKLELGSKIPSIYSDYVIVIIYVFILALLYNFYIHISILITKILAFILFDL